MKKRIVQFYGLETKMGEGEREEDETQPKLETMEAAATAATNKTGEEEPSPEEFRAAFFNLSMTMKDGVPAQIPNIPYLFIGSIGSAYNSDNLVKAGITHILCLSDVIRLNFPDKFKYLRVPMVDKPDYDINADLHRVFSFIESVKCYVDPPNQVDTVDSTDLPGIAHTSSYVGKGDSATADEETAVTSFLSKPGKVLVHCYQGKSRCATVCSAYLMKYYGYSVNEAIDLIRQVRPIASPNTGFMRALHQLAVELQQKQEDGADQQVQQQHDQYNK
mmetsp:Transcript_19305/g.32731  ORF Transcript_19305/g.32731 Transcript_19305/m.32731 type:complete len:276 (-) Transcript_19305:2756-3583(-)